MNVRYETLAGEGFALSSEDVTVVASPYEGAADGEPREADAKLRIGNDLEVGYGGVYECAR
jgi:hypothetical protein